MNKENLEKDGFTVTEFKDMSDNVIGYSLLKGPAFLVVNNEVAAYVVQGDSKLTAKGVKTYDEFILFSKMING